MLKVHHDYRPCRFQSTPTSDTTCYVFVTSYRFKIDNYIYWTLVTPNYKYLQSVTDLHTL
jgi:hypothetical protein